MSMGVELIEMKGNPERGSHHPQAGHWTVEQLGKPVEQNQTSKQGSMCLFSVLLMVDVMC